MTRLNHDVAVIGMAVHAPGAGSLEQLWLNLLARRDAFTHTSDDELSARVLSWAKRKDLRYRSISANIEDRQRFDAEAFGWSAFEAEQVAASHRHFLEISLQALQDGAVVSSPDLRIGVVTSVDASHFDQLSAFDADPRVRIPRRVGGAPDFMAARVAHALDLKGPSLTLLSACSSTLAGAHLACQTLREGGSDVMLLGGSAVSDSPRLGYLGGLDGMISQRGQVRPFDAGADGTIFDEAVAALALCRLSTALEKGYPVRAIIAGSAVGNDGDPEDKASFVAPSVSGQMEVLEGALENAKVEASAISMVEAHGTGTLLGDPIEVEVLSTVYGRQGATDVGLGSIKANVGHGGPVAGALSLIKACLALEKGVLPPQANFQSPNPRLHLDDSPFHIPTRPIPRQDLNMASVSGFGFGGSNAHFI